MTARDLLLSKRIPGNPIDQQAAAQRALAELANREVVVPQLSGIATDFGVINAGTIVMGNGQPLGAGFTGVMQFADPLEWPIGSGAFWHYIGFNSDVMMFGISAADGKLYAAGGKMTVDSTAININDLLTVMSQSAVDSTGKRYYARYGMQNVDAGTPRPQISYTTDPTSNLVANPDFETGSLLHWSGAGGTWAARTDKTHGGSYAAAITNTGIQSSQLTSDQFAVTGGARCEAGAWYNHSGQTMTYYGARLQVEWYDAASGGSLIATNQVLLPFQTGQWLQGRGLLTAPANALGAKVILLYSTLAGVGTSYFDDVTFGVVTTATRLTMEPEVTISGAGLRIEEQAAPSAPAAGYLTAYPDTGHLLRIITSLGHNMQLHGGHTAPYYSIGNTAATQSLYLKTIKAGSMGTKGTLLVIAAVNVHYAAQHNGQNLLWVLSFGGITVTGRSTAASLGGTRNQGTFFAVAITNNGSAGTQRVQGVVFENNGGADSATPQNTFNPFFVENTTSINTAVDCDLEIRGTMSLASTDLTLALEHCTVIGPVYAA